MTVMGGMERVELSEWDSVCPAGFSDEIKPEISQRISLRKYTKHQETSTHKMARTAQTASQTAKKGKKEKRAKEGNDDRSEKRAKVSSNDKEDKKRRRLIKWMLDWEPDYTPEQLEKMTISDMEKIFNEPLSDDAEEIDPDNEKVTHKYKGEMYTSRELNNQFHREAYESNKRYCDYMKQKNKKGDKKPRGAPPKSNAWQLFLGTNRVVEI